MANKLMDKFLGIIGFEEEMTEEDERYQDTKTRDEEEAFSVGKKKGQVLNLHAQRQLKVVVAEPKVFEDVQNLTDNLKNRKPVIINLEKADAELARRVVDFISGAIYALNGNFQKVGNNIFLVVPSNMDIQSEIGEHLKERGLFPWVNKV